MLMPSIFGENLFDDFFNDFPFYDYDKEMKNTEKKLYGRKASHVMKTDIRELDNGYEVVVYLPGFCGINVFIRKIRKSGHRKFTILLALTS